MSNAPTNQSARTASPTNSRSVLLGAVVTLVATPLSPFGGVLGGATASYYYRATLGRGAVLGALSGALVTYLLLAGATGGLVGVVLREP